MPPPGLIKNPHFLQAKATPWQFKNYKRDKYIRVENHLLHKRVNGENYRLANIPAWSGLEQQTKSDDQGV